MLRTRGVPFSPERERGTKRKNFALWLGCVAALLACLAGCTPASVGDAGESAPEFYQFTDSAGNQISAPKNPQNVAVLFSSFADIWTIAGGRVSITVGESVERGFADESAVLVDDGAGKSIQTEALIAAQPDLVICSMDLAAQAEAAQLLQDTGIPCAQFRVESFDDYLTMLKICTDLTGNSDAYEQYGAQVGKKIDALLEQVDSVRQDPRILFIRSGSGASSAKAKTAQDHFAAAMLEQLGCRNIADNAPVLLDGLSIEEIMSEDPTYIFIATMGDESAARAYMDSVLAEPTWQSLTAVKEGRCFYLPKDLFQFKPNASWYEAYAYLAGILYPELQTGD